MIDNLDPRDAGLEEEAARAEPSRQPPEEESTVADREVLPVSAHTPEVIQAWLDGESVSEAQLHASEREYEFWRRVEEEAVRRRRMKTPSGLPGQIMKAIRKEN